MNYVLFVTIIAWFGLVVFGLLTVASVYNWYYHNFTSAGKLTVQLYAIKGITIQGYYFWQRFIVFVVCLAAVISL